MMRLPLFKLNLLIVLLLLVLPASGCEIGNRWFSMSSDSPSPWFGFDLVPKKRSTTQVLPHSQAEFESGRYVSSRNSRGLGKRKAEQKVWSKEIHLPSIPALFDQPHEEEISFTGPVGPFNR
ncbi:hypothetical protein SH668x_000871 [Planctomicrobium sp. SH668]|uniref:hypothetical protein n=1 Tax=Planctomicrobium sp. SH668 TaxID=3448126 RepID=UPI003F5C6F6C